MPFVDSDSGKASVGKLGSLMHSYTNNHRLSAMCKEKYGGLKKFLEAHADLFAIGQDHPFNPSVWLISSALTSSPTTAKHILAPPGM
jgi:hypothetical protein